MTNFVNFADMFNGGGAGGAGDTFMGGPFSGLLNAIGIRPHGYAARHNGGAGLLSQMGGGGGMAPNSGFAAPPATPEGIAQTPLIGSMTAEQLQSLLEYLRQTQDPYRIGPR